MRKTTACVILIFFLENPCLNWHYGVDVDSCSSDLSNLDAFRSMPIPAKDKMLSVICSTKTFTAAQHKRIAFVEKLFPRNIEGKYLILSY